MPAKPKLLAGDYYESLPHPGFGAGDLWQDLPTFGLLGRSHAMGIVITPACDLANRKAETITYLPVIPIPDYLNGMALVPDLVRTIRGQAQAAEVVLSSCDAVRGYDLPHLVPLESDVQQLRNVRAALRDPSKRVVAIDRAIAGLTALIRLRRGERQRDLTAVESAFGAKEFAKIVEAIVRNGFSNDIHFLPADGKAETLSAMPIHSVTLFRYPTTLPCALLEIAEDLTQSDWVASLEANYAAFPSSRHLAEKRPIRVSTVKPRFYSDLVARFIALLVRLGSPDFSSESIEHFADQIRG